MSDDWKAKFRVGSVHRGSDGKQYLILWHDDEDATCFACVIGERDLLWFDTNGVSKPRRHVRLIQHVGDMVMQPVWTTLVPVDPDAVPRGGKAKRWGRPRKDDAYCLYGEIRTAHCDHGLSDFGHLIVEPIEPPQKPDPIAEARKIAERIKANPLEYSEVANMLADALFAKNGGAT